MGSELRVSKSTAHGQPILNRLGYLLKMQTLDLRSRPTQSEYTERAVS